MIVILSEHAYTIKIDTSGIERMRAEMPEKVRMLRYWINMDVSIRVLDMSKLFAPVRTGYLKNSIETDPKIITPDTEEVAVGPFAEYGYIRELSALHKWPRGPWYMKRASEDAINKLDIIVNDAMKEAGLL